MCVCDFINFNSVFECISIFKLVHDSYEMILGFG